MTATSPIPITSLQLMALSASSIRSERISNRSQGGRTLSYVEAYDIRAMLIKVFGFAGWDYVVEDAQIIQVERDVPNSKGGTTAFRVTALVRSRLTIHQTGASYGGVAVASQSGPDIGEVSDFAMKTADSDALKRCAMNLGTQYGLSLYNDGSLKDVVGMGFAPGQEWNVPTKLIEMAAEHEMAVEAGEIPTAPTPTGEAKAQLDRALRVNRDDAPMALDPSYDESEALSQ